MDCGMPMHVFASQRNKGPLCAIKASASAQQVPSMTAAMFTALTRLLPLASPT